MKVIYLSLILLLSTLSSLAQIYSYPEQLTMPNYGPVQASFTDISGTGDIDIMVLDPFSHELAWYPGDGQGGFADSETIPVGTVGAAEYLVGDFDEDGLTDIFVVGYDEELLRLNRRLDENTFAPEEVFSSIPSLEQLSQEDVNGDGHLDFVFLDQNNLYFIAGLGDGYFGAAKFIVDGTDISQYAFGDFNGDSQTDVAFVREGQYVAWCAGLVVDGENGFYSDEIFIDIDVPGAYGLHVDDVDQDGDLDLLTTHSFTGIVQYHENGANGSMGTFSPHEVFSLSGVRDIYSADMDNDGDKDVVVSTETELYWYEKNNGLAQWTDPELISTGTSPIRDFDVEDVDNDGRAEVVMARYALHGLVYFENGVLGVDEGRAISSGAVGLTDIGLADIDGDGDNDLVSASEQDDKLAWYENEGQGARAPQHIISDQMDGAWRVLPISDNADVDDDLMLWTGDQFDADLVYFENENGTLESVDFANRPLIISSSAANMEGSSRQEVAVGSAANSGQIFYYGQFPSVGGYIVEVAQNTSAIHSVTAADMTGNGLMDILAHNSAFGDLVVYSRTIGTTWNSGITIGGDQSFFFEYNTPIVPTDFDQDGDLDVLIFAHTAGPKTLYLYRQGDDSSFSVENMGVIADNDNVLIAGDVEGDGDVDVLTIGDDAFELRWHLNDGNGLLSQSIIVDPTQDTAGPVAQAVTDDADGDGDLDLYISAGEIYYAENSGLFCPADVDRNGVVDISDFLIFNSSYGDQCPGYCPSDIDGNGVVDVQDFIAFNSAYGTGCN